MKNRVLVTRKSLQEAGCTEEMALAMGLEIVDEHVFKEDESSVLTCVYDTDEVDPKFAKDNERGPCALCGVGLQYRPGIPAKIMRLCIPCTVSLQTQEIH